jgi:hypothetical protein
MKTFPSTRGTAALALLLGCLATSALAAELSKPASAVEITFTDPESYTDWKLSDGADWYRESVFTAMRSFVAAQAEPMLPAGYTLKLAFTDMDLGHRASRQLAAPGAPALEFSYRVMDASGTVVRHGTESLKFYTDWGNYRGSIATTDLSTEIIQTEKPMLKSWATTALADLMPH